MKGAVTIAAELSVTERILLFCLASGTEWKKVDPAATAPTVVPRPPSRPSGRPRTPQADIGSPMTPRRPTGLPLNPRPPGQGSPDPQDSRAPVKWLTERPRPLPYATVMDTNENDYVCPVCDRPMRLATVLSHAPYEQTFVSSADLAACRQPRRLMRQGKATSAR
jgi:hypothetical protein